MHQFAACFRNQREDSMRLWHIVRGALWLDVHHAQKPRDAAQDDARVWRSYGFRLVHALVQKRRTR